MKIFLRLTKSLALLNKGQKETVLFLTDSCSVAEFIDFLDNTMPGLKNTVLNQSSDISDGINLYVNGKNIRSLAGTGTLLAEGDTVGIIPAAAAG